MANSGIPNPWDGKDWDMYVEQLMRVEEQRRRLWELEQAKAVDEFRRRMSGLPPPRPRPIIQLVNVSGQLERHLRGRNLDAFAIPLLVALVADHTDDETDVVTIDCRRVMDVLNGRLMRDVQLDVDDALVRLRLR